MNSIGWSLLYGAAIIFVGLCCLTLPTATATHEASHSSLWQQLRQLSPSHNSASHRHGRLSTSLAAQDGSVWAGQSYSAAIFPVDGNNSSPVYASVEFSHYVVSVHRRDSGADDSRNYSIPLQYALEEMVATTDRVVLRLQGSNQSCSTIHVLDARQLTMLAAYDTDYVLAFAGINAAGDTLMTTTVPGGTQLVALDAVTGKSIAAYDGGLRSLQIGAAALHPTDGRMAIVNGSYPNAINVVILSANNSLLLSWPVVGPGNHVISGCGIDLSGRVVTVRIFGHNDQRDYLYWQLLQYDLSSGQLRSLRQFPVDDFNVYIGLSPAPYEMTALLVGEFGRLIVVDAENNALPLPGVTPVLTRPSGVVVLEGAGRDRSVLVTVNGRLGLLELDDHGGSVGAAWFYDNPTLSLCTNFFEALLTADERHRVYAEQCNGSIAQFDGNTRQLLAVTDILVAVGFQALTAGPDNSVFYVDEDASSVIRRVQMAGGGNQSVIQLPKGSEVWSLAYDHRNGTLWLIDQFGQILQLGAGGAVISNFSCPDSASPVVRSSYSDDSKGRCLSLVLDRTQNRLVLTYAYVDGNVSLFIVWLDMHSGALQDSQPLPSPRVWSLDDYRLAVSNDGRTTYVASWRTNEILIFQQPERGIAATWETGAA